MTSSGRAAALLLALAVGVGTAGCGLRPAARQAADVLEPMTATGTVTTAPGASSPPVAPSVVPSPSSSPRTAVVPPPPDQRRTALALVGRWSVTGADVPPGAALVVGSEIAVFLPCGVLDADWDADGDEGLFLAHSSSGDSACFGSERYPLPWLEGATGFDRDGDRRRLLGTDGRTLALLTPGARPTTGPNRSETSAQEPEVTPQLRARLSPPAPLPDGETAPTEAQLRGRWVPMGTFTSDPYVRFDADGSYAGSDGCNGQGGRWVLGTQGRLLGTGGAQTLIGCDGAPAGAWVAQAARAGLQGDRLVLHGSGGEVLGRLVRG